MKTLRLFVPAVLALAAPLALVGCGYSQAGEQPLPAESPVQQDALAPPPAGDSLPEATPEATVVEVEVDPEIAGAEPMDTAAPMADPVPMSDDFGLTEGGERPAE